MSEGDDLQEKLLFYRCKGQNGQGKEGRKLFHTRGLSHAYKKVVEQGKHLKDGQTNE